MSRLNQIASAVAVHAVLAWNDDGATLSVVAEPQAAESLSHDGNPHGIFVFEEDAPERLDFKQQRRRVVGTCQFSDENGITRETMDLRIEGTRDRIFADETLSASVDDVTAEAGITFSSPDDTIVYGTLDVTTEEIF